MLQWYNRDKKLSLNLKELTHTEQLQVIVVPMQHSGKCPRRISYHPSVQDTEWRRFRRGLEEECHSLKEKRDEMAAKIHQMKVQKPIS